MKDRYSDILIRNETDYMRRDVHTAKRIIKLLSSGTLASVIWYIYIQEFRSYREEGGSRFLQRFGT